MARGLPEFIIRLCLEEFLVVPPARFQRATFRLGGGRSMQLSYGETRRATGGQPNENSPKHLLRPLYLKARQLLAHLSSPGNVLPDTSQSLYPNSENQQEP